MWRAKGERQRGRGERLMSKGGPKFKELRVWQKGKELAVYIHQITNIKYALKFKIDFGTVENLLPLTLSLPLSHKDKMNTIQRIAKNTGVLLVSQIASFIIGFFFVIQTLRKFDQNALSFFKLL